MDSLFEYVISHLPEEEIFGMNCFYVEQKSDVPKLEGLLTEGQIQVLDERIQNLSSDELKKYKVFFGEDLQVFYISNNLFEVSEIGINFLERIDELLIKEDDKYILNHSFKGSIQHVFEILYGETDYELSGEREFTYQITLDESYRIVKVVNEFFKDLSAEQAYKKFLPPVKPVKFKPINGEVVVPPRPNNTPTLPPPRLPPKNVKSFSGPPGEPPGPTNKPPSGFGGVKQKPKFISETKGVHNPCDFWNHKAPKK